MKIKQVILGITLLAIIGLSGLLVYLSQLSIPTPLEEQTRMMGTEDTTTKIYDKNGKLVYPDWEVGK